MSRIGGKDTQPEMLVRKYLFSEGFRYRLHGKKLPGKPDIILPKYAAIIFVNGCFWHGHKKCKYFVIPKTRTEWWLNKIKANILRDRRRSKDLICNGWKVVVVWECQLKPNRIEGTIKRLIRTILS